MQVTIRKQRFARALAAVLVACSDDETRTSITQVQCWQAGDKLHLASTDGHWMASWCDVVGDEQSTPRIGISRRGAKFLAGAIALDKCDDADAAEAEEMELTLAGGIEIECETWTVKLPDTGIEGPDLDALVKGTQRGEVSTIALSPAIMADVRKAFKVCGNLSRDAEQMEYGFGPSEVSPVLITSSAVPELACVVMPRVPVDVDMSEVDGERRYVRRDTGEVIHSEAIDRQSCIPGTEPDPVAASVDALQALADKSDTTLDISVNGGKAARIEPRKRGKKAEVQG